MLKRTPVGLTVSVLKRNPGDVREILVMLEKNPGDVEEKSW